MSFEHNLSDVKREIINEVHKPARRNIRRRWTIIKGYANSWQAVSWDVQTHAKKNCGFRNILVVIVLYSLYVWTELVKT